MYVNVSQERMSKIKDEVSRLRGAIPAFRLMMLDREAKIAATKAGDDEQDDIKGGRPSRCSVM